MNPNDSERASPEAARISVQEVRRQLLAGAPTLLVCIYPQAAYEDSHLEGAISMDDFEARLPRLSRGQEIVFY